MDLSSYYATAKQFFEQQSAAANAIAIITAAITIALTFIKLSRLIRNRFSPCNVATWVDAQFTKRPTHLNSAARSAIRIAIVDDQLEDIPTESLIEMGYKLETFTEIALADAEKLKTFDLLLLDIANVVKSDPMRGGLEIIKRLKSMTDAPIVVAISGKRYDPTVLEFFQLADTILKKPIKEIELDSLVARLLSPIVVPPLIAEGLDNLIDSSFISSDEKRRATRKVVALLKARSAAISDSDSSFGRNRSEVNKLLKAYARFARKYEAR